ncbi:ATP-dependent lipid A-core flippase-like [Schistocerca nitens]|uniref:ATP-dependent lipid A-core flippase-like n=1 Tax=Schistocerca nitens TaxID=7011 RepID=UPI0021194BDF|nr:ATP-dependent lipid A-core flippase-like [Schistocerca nitens]
MLASQLAALAPNVLRGELAAARVMGLISKRSLAYNVNAEFHTKWLLDGRDVSQTSLAVVRRQMALADANATFFRRTVASNIAYGCWDARTDDIISAAKEAGAHDFITALPEGYATVLDGRVTLTPSQRLRLSLARAVLRDATVLLVENLRKVEDDDAEALVEAALRRACLGRTCILACQQPQCAAVRAAQWVCVMRTGAIAEQGPVAFLAASRSLYRRLCYSSTVD